MWIHEAFCEIWRKKIRCSRRCRFIQRLPRRKPVTEKLGRLKTHVIGVSQKTCTVCFETARELWARLGVSAKKRSRQSKGLPRLFYTKDQEEKKMKKTTRFSSIVLTLVLILSLLAGCAKSAETARFTLRGYTGAADSYEYAKQIDGLKVEIKEGASALDVISAALAAENYTFADESYISAVTAKDGTVMSQGDLGENSGWLFAVNGKIPEVGMADCPVKAGDSVELVYVADFNTDVNWETGTFID